MPKIKHSKLKNTGILFELLVRQIASDTISDNDSKAVNLIKKYFSNSELSKEYKLYQVIVNAKNLNENKANAVLNSVLELSKKLNKKSLRNLKYNLIKEIKENYNIDDFFKIKINNYKEYAAVYNLFEAQNSDEFIEPSQIIDNKCTLLEHITKNDIDKDKVKDDILEEYIHFDKGTRLLTYRLFVDKFNKKYSSLLVEQKLVLKEFINNISNTNNLKEFINNKILVIRKELREINKNIEDTTTKVKITEILTTMLKPIDSKSNVKDGDVINLLQYYELLKEFKNIK